MSARARAQTQRQSQRRIRKTADKVLGAVMGTHWAITRDSLETIISVATRQNLDPQVIEMMHGEELRNTYNVTMRDNIATLPVHGPMFRYADFFSRVSGATSYEDLATDFQSALDDPRIKAIVLDIDSPGGAVNGCSELARAIFAARGRKPIIAYVSNWACSGAYWIAAACDEIVAHETAMLGSIGCVAAYIDDTKAMAEAGLEEIVIVSSQSPKKDVNPSEPDGRSQIQVILDDLAAVFIADVSTFRGMSAETVLKVEGGVLVGRKCIEAGLADRLGNYEALHAELLARETTPSGVFSARARPASSTTGAEVKDTVTAPAASAAAPAVAATTGSEGSETGTEKTPSATGGTAEENVDETDDAPDTPPEEAPADEKKPKPGEPGYEAHVRSIAAAAERKRIAGIRALGKPGEEKTIQACIDDAECTVEQAAVRLRQAEGNAGASHLAKLSGDDAGKHASNAAAPTDVSPEAAAKKSVAAFYDLRTPKAQSPNRSSR